MQSWLIALLLVASCGPLLAQEGKVGVGCDLWSIGTAVRPDAQALLAECSQLIDSGKMRGAALAKAYLVRILARSSDPRTVDHRLVIADATRVIEIDPQERLAFLFRCDSYQQTGEYDRAIEDASKYIELDPTDWNAFNVRSNVYSKMGLYDLAIADDTRALHMAPKHSAAHANRAETYLRAGKIEKAMADIDQAISMSRDVPHYHFTRGKIHEAFGRTEEAIADYRKAHRSQPNHASYREALIRLGVVP